MGVVAVEHAGSPASREACRMAVRRGGRGALRAREGLHGPRRHRRDRVVQGALTICLGLGSRPVAASRSMRSTPGTAGSVSPSSTRISGGPGIERLVTPVAAASGDAYPASRSRRSSCSSSTVASLRPGRPRLPSVDAEADRWRHAGDARHERVLPRSCRVAEEQMYKGTVPSRALHLQLDDRRPEGASRDGGRAGREPGVAAREALVRRRPPRARPRSRIR